MSLSVEETTRQIKQSSDDIISLQQTLQEMDEMVNWMYRAQVKDNDEIKNLKLDARPGH